VPAAIGARGARADLPIPTSAERMSVREPSPAGEIDGGMSIRIRKSSGVRARPIDQRASVEEGEAAPREQVGGASASSGSRAEPPASTRVRRKSDG
jgi:hypothetical protein